MLMYPSAVRKVRRERREVVVAEQLRLLMADEQVGRDPPEQRHDGVEHRHVDELPCRCARDGTGRHDREGGVEAADRVADGKPQRSGFRRSSPLIAITPLSPWMIWSYAGFAASGPVWPKPEIAQ